MELLIKEYNMEKYDANSEVISERIVKDIFDWEVLSGEHLSKDCIEEIDENDEYLILFPMRGRPNILRNSRVDIFRIK